jgi:hypothetical protein
MYSLIFDKFFEQHSRSFPGNTLEIKKSDVKPGAQQPVNILIQGCQIRVASCKWQEFGAEVDKKFNPFLQFIELSEEFGSVRDQEVSQLEIQFSAFFGINAVSTLFYCLFNRLVVDIVFPGEQFQKPLPAIAIQYKICLPEFCGPCSG